MTGFTKGEWWASGSRVFAHSENPLDADDPMLVAHVDASGADCDMDVRIDHDTEATANARLIAAAPDLYEALRSVSKVIVAYLNDAGASIEDLNACVNSIDAALAKAAGTP